MTATAPSSPTVPFSTWLARARACACWTPAAARDIWPAPSGLGADVVGADACESLIDAAGALPADGPGPVSFACASVDALPLRADSFDLFVCNHVFSHLYDPSYAIGEFARVLRSGGWLVILTLHPCFYTANAERGATQSGPTRVSCTLGYLCAGGRLRLPATERWV